MIAFLLAMIFPGAIGFALATIALRRPWRRDPSPSAVGGEGEGGSSLALCSPKEHARELAEWDKALAALAALRAPKVASPPPQPQPHQLPSVNRYYTDALIDERHALQNIAFDQAYNQEQLLNSIYNQSLSNQLGLANQQCQLSQSQLSGQLSSLGHADLGMHGSPLLESLLGLSKSNRGNHS